jgi:hypothetical protein
MKELIKRSYQAEIKRGNIKKDTHIYSFFAKLEEEFDEAEEACDLFYTFNTIEDKQHYIEELMDIANVCINQVTHLGHDPIHEYEKIILKNEKRANDKQGI